MKPTDTLSRLVPVTQSERIAILDSLRGIAILGILLMNIPGFGFPENRDSDPSIMNETGWNYRTWYFVDWALTGTQRALFSMLYGAGIILFINRQIKKVDGLTAAEYYYRRQLWLLLFGLFNAFVLLWFWDILFNYAICGMLLFVFHRLSPKALIAAAAVSLLLMTARENRDLYLDKQKIAKGELAAAIDTTKTKLTDQQKDDLAAMRAFKEKTTVDSRRKSMEREQRGVLGDYAALYEVQSEKSLYVELYYTYFKIFDLFVFMFLGMAFYKSGILMGKASSALYWWMFIIGLGGGLALSWLRLQPYIENRFNTFEFTKNVSFRYYELARTFRAVGFFGLIMLLYKSGWFKWLFSLMRPVGQMAFTNYLMQSLTMGLFFYGIGFGMFGKLQRYELYYVVGVVWVVEIIWSHIWLRYFNFGPMEWLWRSLTYWKRPPFKKTVTSHVREEVEAAIV